MRNLSRSALAIALSIGFVFPSSGSTAAVGPGNWGHVGDGGTAGTSALNLSASALNADTGLLLVGGAFTDAGGEPDADRIAFWTGTTWMAVSSGSSQISNGSVDAIAYADGKIYAGGTFVNAGGNGGADFLAVWDGSTWAPFCNDPAPPAFNGAVKALEVIGSTLYVGGTYQNGAHIPSADYLLACDLTTGAASSPFATDGAGSGAIYALAADSGGILYAAGTFINIAGIPAADYVAAYSGGAWSAMGTGFPNGGAVNGITRSLATSGTRVYIGSDAVDISAIPQADNVAAWDGSAWSAVGSNTAGSDGVFSTGTSIDGLVATGNELYATGSFQNPNGNPLADNITYFNGVEWSALGSDGAGNGPLNANGLALAHFAGRLFVAGGFTAAGGDTYARGIACYLGCTIPPIPSVDVDCSPAAVTVGQSSSCTATVNDTRSPPGPRPTGIVQFTTNRPGGISDPECTLSPIASFPQASSCSRTVTPHDVGERFLVTYQGDDAHSSYISGVALTVTNPPSNNFTIPSNISCVGACNVVKAVVTFDSPGEVIAEQAPRSQQREPIAAEKKAKPLIKKLTKAVSAGKNTLKLKLTAAGKAALKKKGTIKLKVLFTFTPTGGAAKVQAKTFKVRPPKK